MRRLIAIVCLTAVTLSVLYSFQFLRIREKLDAESARISRLLRYFLEEDVLLSRAFFESPNDNLSALKSVSKGQPVFPGIYKTTYTSSGLPEKSTFPPIPATLHPMRIDRDGQLSANSYWLQTRWFVLNKKLWVETLLSSKHWPPGVHETGSPILGWAIPISRDLLMREDQDFELVLYHPENLEPSRFTELRVKLPDQNSLDPYLHDLILKYKIGLWTHILFLGLTWILVSIFIRFIRYKPSKPSKREVQLQEELSYLSHTYQDLSKSLRMERQKVESILNSAPDGIFTCAPDGTVTLWNRSMETFTGLPEKGVIGRHYHECLNIFSSSGQLLVDPFSPCLTEGRNLSFLDCLIETTSANSGEGTPVNSLPVALGAAPVRHSDGLVEEVVITVKDIRVQKEAERLKKDMQAMITHDLRSPVSAMLGYAGLIRNAKLCKNEQEAEKYLDALIRSGKGMLILISNLLGWSGLEAGKLTVHKEPVLLPPILKEMADSFEILAKPKGVSVVAQASDAMWAMTDPEKLKEILTNLLANAIKFSRPGGVVQVGVVEEGEKVKISVSDEGPGIPEEERDKLFLKFSTLREKESGTGLGLYIVKMLTDALDGSVEFTSELGEGSTFTITLPGFQKVNTPPRQLSLLSLGSTADTKK